MSSSTVWYSAAWLAGWLSSLCTERLANNLSAPVGYEASMSTTGPVFRRPAMEIREQGCSGHSAGKGGGRRAKRKLGRAGGIPGSLSGRVCSSDCVLQQSQPFRTERKDASGISCLPATAHYHWHKGTEAPCRARVCISSHQDACGVPLMHRTSYVFSI